MSLYRLGNMPISMLWSELVLIRTIAFQRMPVRNKDVVPGIKPGLYRVAEKYDYHHSSGFRLKEVGEHLLEKIKKFLEK